MKTLVGAAEPDEPGRQQWPVVNATLAGSQVSPTGELVLAVDRQWTDTGTGTLNASRTIWPANTGLL